MSTRDKLFSVSVCKRDEETSFMHGNSQLRPYNLHIRLTTWPAPITGLGFESDTVYPFAELQFLNIANIHVMRDRSVCDRGRTDVYSRLQRGTLKPYPLQCQSVTPSPKVKPVCFVAFMSAAIEKSAIYAWPGVTTLTGWLPWTRRSGSSTSRYLQLPLRGSQPLQECRQIRT